MFCYFRVYDVLHRFVLHKMKSNSAVDSVACKLFISSSSDPGPCLPMTHPSEIINSTSLFPCLVAVRRFIKENSWILINESLPSCTIFLQYCPECALFSCYLEILLTYHWKAQNTILNKQCHPIFFRNGTLITLCVVRIEFFLKCDIWTDYISVKAEWRKESHS